MQYYSKGTQINMRLGETLCVMSPLKTFLNKSITTIMIFNTISYEVK